MPGIPAPKAHRLWVGPKQPTCMSRRTQVVPSSNCWQAKRLKTAFVSIGCNVTKMTIQPAINFLDTNPGIFFFFLPFSASAALDAAATVVSRSAYDSSTSPSPASCLSCLRSSLSSTSRASICSCSSSVLASDLAHSCSSISPSASSIAGWGRGLSFSACRTKRVTRMT